MAWTTPRTWVAGELVTESLMNTYVRDNQSAIVATTGAYVNAVVGPHAIGGATSDYVRLHLTGNFTSGGASTSCYGTLIGGVLTGHVTDTAGVMGTVLGCHTTTAVSAALVAQLYVDEPAITVAGGTTLTSSATVYIKAAATEATSNYALWVDSGDTRLDGDTIVGPGLLSGDGTLHVHTATAGSVTAASSGDNLIVENSADSGISILSPDNSSSVLMFGSPSDNNGLELAWSYSSKLGQIRTRTAGGQLAFATADGAEAVRITAAGDVGIGTTAPGSYGGIQSNLEVQSTTHASIAIDAANTASLGVLQFASAGLRRWAIEVEGSATPALSFNEAGSVRMTLDNGGNVGINQVSPTHKLHVTGDIKLQNSQVHLSDGYGLLWGTTGFNGNAATDSLRFDTAGGARINVDSSGNVGIGVTDADVRLDVSSGENKLDIFRITQRLSGAAAFGLQIGLDPSPGDPVFCRVVNDTATEAFRVQRSSGLVAFSNGVSFSPAETTAANTLDDYEEGTFTPVLTGTTSASGVAYDTQAGTYTKVGNRVAFNLAIDLSSKGTIVGFLKITGLPFTNGTSTSVQTAAGFSRVAMGDPYKGIGHVYGSSNYMYLFLQSQDSDTGDSQMSTSHITANTIMMFSGNYTAA